MSTELTREQRIKEAEAAFLEEKAKRQKEREEANDKKNNKGNYDFEEKVYAPLNYGETRIVRILSNGKDSRRGSPYAAKEVLLSKIIGDDGKQFNCIWPSKEERPDWILWKIFNKIMAYKWDKELNGGKGGRVYTNTTNPLFNRVAKNGRDASDKNISMEKGWEPARTIQFNIIDRNDTWCKENKHSKLISKKVSAGKDGSIFADEGIPITLYNKIRDDIVEYYGPWVNYDIALTKVKTGSKDSDVEYKAIHCEKHLEEVDEKVRNFIVTGFLTDEELAYEMYDIDKFTKTTSYRKILSKLGIFIQSFDKIFNTKFYDELKDLAEQEKKQYEVNKETTTEQKIETLIETKTEVKKEEITKTIDETPVTTRLVEEMETKPKTFTVSSLDSNAYKGLVHLTDELKKFIIGQNPDGTLIYSKEAGQLIPCPVEACKFLSPFKMTHCPKCGIKYK